MKTLAYWLIGQVAQLSYRYEAKPLVKEIEKVKLQNEKCLELLGILHFSILIFQFAIHQRG